MGSKRSYVVTSSFPQGTGECAGQIEPMHTAVCGGAAEPLKFKAQVKLDHDPVFTVLCVMSTGSQWLKNSSPGQRVNPQEDIAF